MAGDERNSPAPTTVIYLGALCAAIASFLMYILWRRQQEPPRHHDRNSQTHGTLVLLIGGAAFVVIVFSRVFYGGLSGTSGATDMGILQTRTIAKPTDYRWGHAINNDGALRAALANKSINAIEADIILSKRRKIPVMGHPPAEDGDLTLENFLHIIVQSNFQGRLDAPNNIVKLDFKCSESFKQSISIVRDFVSMTGSSNGLMLNADIIQGPCDKKPLFNPEEFLRLAASISGAILSVGWTTADNAEPYTLDMVNEMLNLLKKYPTTSVTFPIKATTFLKSWDALQHLYSNIHHGITLWWSGYEMPSKEIQKIYNMLENDPRYKGRTYYDIKGFDKFIEGLRELQK